MPTIGSFSQDDLFGQEGTLETLTLKSQGQVRAPQGPQREAAGLPHSHRQAGLCEVEYYAECTVAEAVSGDFRIWHAPH